MESLTYRLADFEGPLDLLLSLVNKNKMNINDIAISVICEQYMEFLSEAEEMDMDIASDFIVMASELMLIKSRMLLPKVNEDEEDPRAWLAEALLIYKRAKEAAEELLPLYTEYSGRMVKDEDEIKVGNELPSGLDAGELSTLLHFMLKRLEATENSNTTLIKPLVRQRVVSVSERVGSIVTSLRKSKTATLYSLLAEAPDRASLIASFLALLELIRMRQILLCKDEEDTGGDDARGDIEYTVKVKLSDEAMSEDFKIASELD